MYTSYIGKKFLKLYNQKNESNLTARQFFDEVLFPIFFNSDKHFINVANSSFFQQISKKLLNEKQTVHQLRLARFHKNVEAGASLTTLVGYAAQEITAGTSSQVSSLKIGIESEEMYASWIGIGLSVSMGGGHSVLLGVPDLLLQLSVGWNYYRQYLTQTSNLKGNQVETWNAYWLSHILSENYNDESPLESFRFPETTLCKAEKWKKLGYEEFELLSWSKIIFAFAKKYPKSTLTLNCFKFSYDYNETLGFINLYLSEIHHMYELRDKIFLEKSQSILSDKQIQQLSTYYNFKDACKLGTIGLKALEPDKLREFMPPPIGKGKEYKFTDDTSYTQFQIYKIWIIAMLNKTELLELASEAAKALLEFESQNTRTNVSKTLTEEVRTASSLKYFIDKLSEVLDKAPTNGIVFKNIVQNVLKMPTDTFPLFVTLIRFEYNFLKTQQ